MTAKGWYKSLTPEQKKEYNINRRKKYSSATDEKKIQRTIIRKEQEQKWYDALSSEEKEQFKNNRKQRWLKFNQKLEASLSPQEKDKLYKIKLERNMTRYNKLSPEQKQKHLDNCKAYNKKKRLERKILVISHYTNGKMCCMNPKCEVPGGAKDIRALQADHIGGGGRNHAKAISFHMYEWIIKNNYPVGIQILCANCNIIKKLEEREDYKRVPSFKKVSE
jgi:hypothetical protein